MTLNPKYIVRITPCLNLIIASPNLLCMTKQIGRFPKPTVTVLVVVDKQTQHHRRAPTFLLRHISVSTRCVTSNVSNTLLAVVTKSASLLPCEFFFALGSCFLSRGGFAPNIGQTQEWCHLKEEGLKFMPFFFNQTESTKSGFSIENTPFLVRIDPKKSTDFD